MNNFTFVDSFATADFMGSALGFTLLTRRRKSLSMLVAINSSA